MSTLEGTILPDRPGPRHVRSAGDVTTSKRPLLRVVRHMQQFATILSGAPYIHQRSPLLKMLHHVLSESPYLGVVAGRDRVVGVREGRYLLGHRSALGLPLKPPAVHDLRVLVPEEPKDPEGVASPPVVLVPVEDDHGIWGDTLLAHQPGEVLRVEVVPDQWVVQILNPVDLDSIGDMAYVIKEHVFVRLHDAHVGVVHVLCEPLGAHQHLWMCIALLCYLLLCTLCHLLFSFLQSYKCERAYSLNISDNLCRDLSRIADHFRRRVGRSLYMSILIDRDGDPKLRGACREGCRGTFGGGGGLRAGAVRSCGPGTSDAGRRDGARPPLRATHLLLAQGIHPSHQAVP